MFSPRYTPRRLRAMPSSSSGLKSAMPRQPIAMGESLPMNLFSAVPCPRGKARSTAPPRTTTLFGSPKKRNLPSRFGSPMPKPLSPVPGVPRLEIDPLAVDEAERDAQTDLDELGGVERAEEIPGEHVAHDLDAFGVRRVGGVAVRLGHAAHDAERLARVVEEEAGGPPELGPESSAPRRRSSCSSPPRVGSAARRTRRPARRSSLRPERERAAPGSRSCPLR